MKMSIKVFGLLMVLGLVAAACGDTTTVTSVVEREVPGATVTSVVTETETVTSVVTEIVEVPPELQGTTVTILTPETDKELSDFRATFNRFSAETGIVVEIEGTRDAADIITIRTEAGDPPDIFIVPQPGRLVDFAQAGDLVPLRDDIVEEVNKNFDAGWIGLGTVDGTLYGVPNKADLKSLVWYNPSVFADNGYAIPQTWDELVALSDQMVEDGITPWCVGLGSGTATGWPFTDWMEDMMLRIHGPEVYDQWVAHEIPFNDPKVVEVAQFVMDFWSTPGYLAGGPSATAGVIFSDAGLPVLDGTCGMHRQANFFASQWPEGTVVAEDGDVNAFYLPTISDEFGTTVLTAGTLAIQFNDRPEVAEVLRFIASTAYADTRAQFGGLLFPNLNMDLNSYPTDIERTMGGILNTADPSRFDGSDLMPGAIGAGEFWTAAVDIVTGSDIEETLTRVEDVWNNLG